MNKETIVTSGFRVHRSKCSYLLAAASLDVIFEDPARAFVAMDARMPPNPLAEFAALEAHRPEDQWTAELELHTPLFVYAI